MAETTPGRKEACNTPPFLQSVEDVRREIASLKELMFHKFEAMEKMLNSYDARYTQRFTGQETAVQAALVGQEKAVNAALTASSTAVNKAEQAQNERMASMNEFRQALTDQGAQMMRLVDQMLRRTEADQRFGEVNEKISRVEQFQSEWTGGIAQSGQNKMRDMWVVGIAATAIVGLISAAAAIVASLLVKH